MHLLAILLGQVKVPINPNPSERCCLRDSPSDLAGRAGESFDGAPEVLETSFGRIGIRVVGLYGTNQDISRGSADTCACSGSGGISVLQVAGAIYRVREIALSTHQ